MDKCINIRGQLYNLSIPRVMGILNITPDSFYSGSRAVGEKEIICRTQTMLQEGADIIDVGAFSTRPGADEVSEQEEMRRLRMALGVIKREFPDAILSIDTYRADVAKMSVEEFGADIINDVSEGGITGRANVLLTEEKRMFKTIAQLNVPYILMSVKENIPCMLKAFAQEVNELHALGVKDIILDPGFGFGKDLNQNYEVLKNMDKLGVLQLPVLVGVSRKRMIQQALNTDAAGSLNGTSVIHALALNHGGNILRVHDVKEAVEVIKIVHHYQSASLL